MVVGTSVWQVILTEPVPRLFGWLSAVLHQENAVLPRKGKHGRALVETRELALTAF